AAPDRILDPRDERLADGDAHRSAHEGEILHADHRALTRDAPKRILIGVAVASLRARRLDAVGIFLGVAELERILGRCRRGNHLVEPAVEGLREPLLGADAVVMVAARADVEIVLPLLDEHHLLALAAFVPEIVGGVALGPEGQGVADAVEPAHAAISLAL